MNVNAPETSPVGLLSKSAARVNTVALVLTYIPLFAGAASFLTRIRSPSASVTPSIVVYEPVVVKVAPTPLAPLLYVTVPLDATARVPVVAALQDALTVSPCAISSTYCLVTASVVADGAARLVILLLLTSTVPVPFGARVMFVLVPAAVIVTPVVLPIIEFVTRFALVITLPVADTMPPVFKLSPVMLPITDRALVALSNVNALLEPALPSLLKITSLFEPVTAKLPEILPITLPKKKAAVILPLALIVPLPNTVFEVALPTVNPVSVPTDVILDCALVVTVPAVVAVPALVAEPLKVAVIILALKLPSASLATTLFAVLVVVASTAHVVAVPPLKSVPVR